MRIVDDPGIRVTLADYARVANLVRAVEAVHETAAELVPRLSGRTVWMINSTAQGGGVAELLPGHIALLRELGVDTRWGVIETDVSEFFAFTKRLHNLIHDAPEAHPRSDERGLYERVNQENVAELSRHVRDGDIVVVHDPQPAAIGAFLKHDRGIRVIWRSHIGLDARTPNTDVAWTFLRPYIEPYDTCVFSLSEYAPSFVRERTHVIHPTIDPLSHKNRELSLHKLIGILSDAGLVVPPGPLLDPPFEHRAQRLQADGTFAAATRPDDIGLLTRPIVSQISRWDRLKGFAPLIDAFRALKRGDRPFHDARHERRIAAVRLVLAGPDPNAIQDDPEARSVLDDLTRRYVGLERELQRDVALVTLPMDSRKHNALMVNAIQRASDVVVQNSLREGFGLTVAEAMWKRAPVLGSGRACGIRLQVRDGTDGRLVDDPENAESIAAVLHDMLGDSDRLEDWGHNAQRRVHDEFLLLGEVRQWLRLLAQ